MDTTQERVAETLWYDRAQRLLEYALLHWHDDEPHSYISAAQECLRIADGAVDPDEMDGYPFPDEDEPECECICPPDLVARGGFKGGCPTHSTRYRQ